MIGILSDWANGNGIRLFDRTTKTCGAGVGMPRNLKDLLNQVMVQTLGLEELNCVRMTWLPLEWKHYVFLCGKCPEYKDDTQPKEGREA